MIRSKIITEGIGPLITLATLRQQCEIVAIDTDSDGVESHPDDALLLLYLEAAVDHAEEFTGRALMLRTYEMALDAWPTVKNDGSTTIEIIRPPFVELVSAIYGDEDTEVDAGDYVLDTYGDMARMRPVIAWPTVVSAANTIRIRYRAGYSSDADPDSDAPALPAAIKAALLLTVGHLYANREASVEKALSDLPLGVEAFLRPKRVRTGMA